MPFGQCFLRTSCMPIPPLGHKRTEVGIGYQANAHISPSVHGHDSVTFRQYFRLNYSERGPRRIRTFDPFRVEEVRYRCAMSP